MKNQSNRSLIPFLVIGLLFLCLIPFQGCEKENDDCTCDTCGSDTNPLVRKPNIYIYPVENCNMSVYLNFPLGGEIVTSIPAYNAGWNFFVDTLGKIDGTYDYLFYESRQPDVWQMEEGWTIRKDELENFFIQNMAEYGFYGREIDDFIEYWIPRLSASNYYQIFPQREKIINSVIQLDITPQPEQILRLYYVIKGVNEIDNPNAVPATIPVFNREGFFITEWGVLLKD